MKKDSLPSLTLHRGGPLLTRRGFIAGAAGLATLAASGGRPFSVALAQSFTAERSLKVGFIVPLTGPIAPEGEAMQRGLMLGLERLNAAGGIGGKPVELVTQDNQSQPSMAATVAKKFIQQEKVDIIVGTVTFDETTAVRALTARSGTPFVTLEAGSYVPQGTPSLACGTSMVTLGETIFQMIDPTVPFMTKRFGGKWAFVGSDYQFPRDYV
ncbi:ABC transporter substrate-binding protein, partial [Rhizobiaceae sp. 2RAB30]